MAGARARSSWGAAACPGCAAGPIDPDLPLHLRVAVPFGPHVVSSTDIASPGQRGCAYRTSASGIGSIALNEFVYDLDARWLD